ncbi:hypothetical protein [Paenibacillus glycanilyticus]|uniref:DUF2334 domain-containing protein n=1 Tax=Paenibacillus glycanilyticus TaxID=126569 RepID=A0ABQ6GJJ7_9BACL|nr:hypothetical protein [Paenibacillus glycanilyticus]GLX70385.1 hypothetical protein MU1_47310 [Paenibacillus glycanilyticus]
MNRGTGIKAWLFSVICLCVLVFAMVPAPVSAQEESKQANVLLVYDSLGLGTSAAGNVEALQRLLLSFGVKVTAIAADEYDSGMAQADPNHKLITVCNTDDLCGGITHIQYAGDWLHIGPVPPERIQERLGLQTKTIARQSLKLMVEGISQDVFMERVTRISEGKGQAFGRMVTANDHIEAPLGLVADGNAYVPYFEPGNVSEMAIAYVLKEWLGAEGSGQAHLLIRGITPFVDLDRLEDLSKQLYEAGIPFLVSVSTLFNNMDSPAMKRYTDALHTVQSYNGGILVEVPTPVSDRQDLEDMKAQMDHFLNQLFEAGIAPLGMTGEVRKAEENTMREAGFAFSDTIVLLPNEKASSPEQDAVQPFPSSPYSMLGEDLLQVSHENKIWPVFPLDVVVTFNWFESEDKQEETVQKLVSSWLPFADFKSGSHNLASSLHKAESLHGALLLDGQPADLQEQAVSAEDAVPVPPAQAEGIDRLFSVQSRVLIVIIVTTLMLFAVFLVIGYRMYKRKYYNSGGSL